LPVYLVVWTLPGLVSAAQLAVSYGLRGDDPPFSLLLRLSLPGWYVWALLAPVVVVAALRWPLPDRWSVRLPLHLGASAVVASVWIILVVAARQLLALPGATRVDAVAVNGVAPAMLTYWALALASFWYRSQREGRARQVRAAELDAELSRARLQALTARLQPHFLFNTMHAISADLRTDPVRAERMLVDLADLLRFVVDAQGREVVALDRELELTRRYVDLQRTRLEGRVEIALDVEARGSPGVPVLLLQPLVENAIEHGAARRADATSIGIRVEATSRRIRVEIEDDGAGLPESFDLERADGVGLATTVARLREHFGSDHRFEVLARPGGGTRVVLDIPALDIPPSEGGAT
jgi:hypothetical protein